MTWFHAVLKISWSLWQRVVVEKGVVAWEGGMWAAAFLVSAQVSSFWRPAFCWPWFVCRRKINRTPELTSSFKRGLKELNRRLTGALSAVDIYILSCQRVNRGHSFVHQLPNLLSSPPEGGREEKIIWRRGFWILHILFCPFLAEPGMNN